MSQLTSLLSNGSLFLSNSLLESFVCPRRFEYLYILRRETATPKTSLSFGDAIHQALALRYITDPNHFSLDLVERTEALLTDRFSNIIIPEGEFRTLEHATRIMRAYNAEYSVEPGEVMATPSGDPFVEQTVTNLLHEYKGIPIFYVSKIDLVMQEHGQPWVWDHKTSTIAGDSYYRDLSVSPQQDGYCWSLWRTTGHAPAGYRINMLPVNAPSKTGKVSLKPNGEYRVAFERPQTFVSEQRLLEWERNTCLLAEQIVDMAERSVFPMQKHYHCVGKYGACQFFDVCTLPEEQRGVMLSSGLFRDKVRATDEIE